ncbi:OmpA family protein [Wenzhouxiangella sp. EGI_FJ10305]|uniref:OmpA family protein n=1 Tax=Wenzhouxiangella sp. EGI_FJ10305 TaxID=3243768 RepID=UPI0035DE1ECE
MHRLLIIALLIPAALAAGIAFAQSGKGTRSLAEIEAELDPLEFIENHDGVRRSIDLNIAFAFDSAELLPDGLEQIDILGRAMNGERLAPYRFRIIGHTDAVGDAEYNRALSERRARAVRTALIENYGIDADRLLAEGKGETELIDGLPEDAAEHRRVEIAVWTEDRQDALAEPEEEKQKESDQIDW